MTDETTALAALLEAADRIEQSPKGTQDWREGYAAGIRAAVMEIAAGVRVAPSPTERNAAYTIGYAEGAKAQAMEMAVAPSPETPGLRDAAQAYLDAFDMPLTTDPEVHYDTLTAAREALRAALAAEPKP